MTKPRVRTKTLTHDMKNPKTKRKAAQSTGRLAPVNVNAKEFIMRQDLEITPLREWLKSEHVFLYLASGFDWYPLCRFGDQCSLFVFCDWWNVGGGTRRIEEFEAAIKNVHNGTPSRHALQCGVIKELEQLDCPSVNAPASF